MSIFTYNNACYPANCHWLAELLRPINNQNGFAFCVSEQDEQLYTIIQKVTRVLDTYGIKADTITIRAQGQNENTSQLPVICHTAEPNMLAWCEHMLRGLRATNVTSGLCLSVPAIRTTDVDTLIASAEIASWGDIKLSWEPYNSIDHFLSYGWPEYEDRQKDAASTIFHILERGEISEIHDVGCGSGEILRSLYDMYRTKGGRQPILHGYDPSEYQIEKAKRTVGEQAALLIGRLEDVNIDDSDQAAVLLLGNTLAHIGAPVFRNWLKHVKNPPRLVVIDFAADWKNLLRRATPEIVCGHVFTCPNNVPPLSAHMTTAGGPGWVKRGVVLDFSVVTDQPDTGNSTAGYSHRLFTRQFADEPLTYEKILEARGYANRGGTIKYVSGWGSHELQVYENAANVQIVWPQIANNASLSICDEWYAMLGQCWHEINEELVTPFTLFPACVVPFCKDRVYARYIRHGEVPDSCRNLFQAWMWVVDPRNQDLHHAGATKVESELPYAPSFHKVLLGRVPASVLESFDRLSSELRLDMNSSDMELADLERLWIYGEDTQLNDADPVKSMCYGIPIYARGIPCYLVIVAVNEFTHVSSVYGSCYYLSERISAIVESWLGNDRWAEYIKKLERLGVTEVEIGSLLDQVKNRAWTNWLTMLPGQKMHLDDSISVEFDQLEANHARIVRSVYPRTDSKLHIGLLCALKEEFDVVVKELGLTRRTEDVDAYGELQLPDAKIKIEIWCARKMSQTATAILATKLFATGRCDNLDAVILVGIAAGQKDCKVGDVLLVKNVDLYSDSMEAVENDGGVDINFGGDPFEPSDDITEWVDKRHNRHEKKPWMEKSSMWLESKLSQEQIKEVYNIIKRKNPKLIIGLLASGNIVAKATAFKRKLSKRERNYNGIDMESGAFLAAAKATKYTGTTIVIRGISDPGDDTKKKLEDCFGDDLREWAMVNCINYLVDLLGDQEFRQLLVSKNPLGMH